MRYRNILYVDICACYLERADDTFHKNKRGVEKTTPTSTLIIESKLAKGLFVSVYIRMCWYVN